MLWVFFVSWVSVENLSFDHQLTRMNCSCERLQYVLIARGQRVIKLYAKWLQSKTVTPFF